MPAGKRMLCRQDVSGGEPTTTVFDEILKIPQNETFSHYRKRNFNRINFIFYLYTFI
jgi:hypothetical protein